MAVVFFSNFIVNYGHKNKFLLSLPYRLTAVSIEFFQTWGPKYYTNKCRIITCYNMQTKLTIMKLLLYRLLLYLVVLPLMLSFIISNI